MPETDLAIREKLMQQFENEGIEPIREQLKKLDPQYFAKVDPSNTQRIIRGLEMVLSSGQKMSDLHTAKTKQRPFRIIKIGLNIDRELLYQRINHRVDVMMQDGLLAEVEKLYPYRDLNALKTVGYSELFDYLDEKSDLETAVAKIKQNTRRFAKRQLTWFRRDSEIHWFSPSNWEQIVAYLSQQLT
jgi:tRNA dimethylallyltransferase